MTRRRTTLIVATALMAAALTACGAKDPVETDVLSRLDSPQAAIDYFDAGGVTDVDGAKVQKRLATTVGEDSWSDDGAALAHALVLAGGQTDATAAGSKLAAQALRVAADHGSVAPKVRVALGQVVAARADALLQLGSSGSGSTTGFDLTSEELRSVGKVLADDTTALAVGVAGLSVQRAALLDTSLDAAASQGTSLSTLRQDERLRSALTSAGQGYGSALAAFLADAKEPQRAIARGVVAAGSVSGTDDDLLDAVRSDRGADGSPDLVLRVGLLDVLLAHGFLTSGDGAVPQATLASGTPRRIDPDLYDGDVDNAPAGPQDAFNAWLNDTAPLDVVSDDATGYAQVGPVVGE